MKAFGEHEGQELIVLGIETSCDETAAAIVARNADGSGRIVSNIVRSQWEKHYKFGGIVPEIAARAHVEYLDEIIFICLQEAKIQFSDLSAIAVTAGPGLIGGLVVGMVTAKSLALAHNKPLIAINHLEAHALTVGLTHGLSPPYLLLLISGGHTQLLLVHQVGKYERLGTTIDDALGEAFDKTANLLGLSQPGGPAVEQAALNGNDKRFNFPRPLMGRNEPHFSFSGLKTAVRRCASQIAPLSKKDIADLCASFQAAAMDTVLDRVSKAIVLTDKRLPSQVPKRLVVAGGVAANSYLRVRLNELVKSRDYDLYIPPTSLCTDNGAMIAWAGAEKLALGFKDQLDVPARARWPLDVTAPKAIGAGIKA